MLTRVFTLTIIIATAFQAPRKQASIAGAWRVSSAVESGTPIAQPQPGLYIFTAHYYSVVQVIGSTPRPPLPRNLSSATAAELLATLGPSFASHSGTYDITNINVLLHPSVAKSPAIMAGMSIGYVYTLKGDTLTLTSTATTNPTVYTLKRLE
jgi:hypothetical protein